MKQILLSLLMISMLGVAGAQPRYALLVIDIQDFYFPGGRSELVDPATAAGKAAEAAAYARSAGQPVVYIKHQASSGMDINDIVRPVPGDAVFVKKEVNSFLGTGLKEHLDSLGADTLVICGMQTHMCVEAAVRAAHDLGYQVILLHDACATRNLEYGERVVSAADVHASTLATLKSYSRVISVKEWTGN